MKSGGAAANETGGLPQGFRRIVNAEGETVIQSPSGELYASEEALETARKGAELVGEFIPPGMSRPFRPVNPDFPPNKSVVDAMESQGIKNMTACDGADCSEIANKLLKAAGGKGTVIEVRPKQSGNLTLFENGAEESGQFYHQVYTDGRYVYDPRLSPNPIPKGDWERHINGMNPEGVTISDKLKGL